MNALNFVLTCKTTVSRTYKMIQIGSKEDVLNGAQVLDGMSYLMTVELSLEIMNKQEDLKH